jgi:hypothetical protein
VATGDGPNRSHPLPSGGGGARKASTVWRQVATATGGYGDRWLRGMGRIVAIRCQAVVGVRGRLPPSGDRWLRGQVATGDGPNRSHPLPSGGGGARKASTVWRQVATATGGSGEGRIGPIGYNPQDRPSPLSPFGVWYQRCDRKNFAFGWLCYWSAEGSHWLRKVPARRIPPGAFKPVCL